MKMMISICLAFCLCLLPLSNSFAVVDTFFELPCAESEVKFVFFNQSTVIIKVANKTILIDPSGNIRDKTIKKLESNGLDLLMFTHDHYDHYEYNAAINIYNATGAHIIADSFAASTLKKQIPKEKLTVSSKNGHYVFDGIEVTAIKGKHIGPIYLYHIKIGDIRIFHGGDSSYVSLKKFPSDVAFVPTGEPSPTCSPKKAFKMARDMKPQVAVAIHGLPSQHMKFKKMMEADLAATSVIIPNYFEPVTITLKK